MLKKCEPEETVTLAPEEIAMLLNAEPAPTESENYLQQLSRQAPRRQISLWQKKLLPVLGQMEAALKHLCPSWQKIKPIKFCRPALAEDAFCARLTAENKDDIYVFFSATDADRLAAILSGGFLPPTAAARAARSEIEQNLLKLVMTAAADSFGAGYQAQIADAADLPTAPKMLQATVPLAFARGEASLCLLLPFAEEPENEAAPFLAANRLQSAADAEICAVAAELFLPARQLQQLNCGSFLPLNLQPDTEIALYCGKNVVFNGLMGKKNRHIAVKITKVTAND